MSRVRALLMLALATFAVATVAQQDEAVDAGETSETPAAVVEELTQAEIDAELARAEEALDESGEVKEFTDAKPLPADLPLALPSDF